MKKRKEKQKLKDVTAVRILKKTEINRKLEGEKRRKVDFRKVSKGRRQKGRRDRKRKEE